MAYTSEINRQNPTGFLFLIDQSGSMGDVFPGETKRKADKVADAINRLLQNLVIKSTFGEVTRDYFHIGVIGYGAQIGPAFGGSLVGKELVPISEVAVNPTHIEERTKKVDDGAGGLVDQTFKFPIWFAPIANGGTPMNQAMSLASKILSEWLLQHPDCFPPVVIHVTDGESTDGDPTETMRKLTDYSSSDGNVLLFNVHLSSNPNVKPLAFPASTVELPDQYAQMLFDTSSPLTPYMLSVLNKEYQHNLIDGTKGFILNAESVQLITMLDVGTKTSTLR